MDPVFATGTNHTRNHGDRFLKQKKKKRSKNNNPQVTRKSICRAAVINVCEQVYNFILLMRLGELFFVLLVHGNAQITLIRIRQPKTIKLNCIEGREILFKLNFRNYWAQCYMEACGSAVMSGADLLVKQFG